MNHWPFANQISSIEPWVMTPERIRLLASCAGYETVSLESPTLILPRKYLFYQYIDFEAVPRSLRANLLMQRIRQLSPFGDFEHWEVAENNTAQVWFWQAGRIIRMHEEQDLPTLSVVPETMLRPPLDNGLRIQPCIEGWELQYWSAKMLRHSRWFANQPTDQDKADFVRICGAIDDGIWSQGDIALLNKPWNEKPFWSRENLISEAVAPRLILGVLLAWLCLQMGLSLGVLTHESVLSQNVASKNKQLKSLVRERDAALQQQEFNQAVVGLVSEPSQLHLLAQVYACVPAETKYSILEWQYQRGQLTVLIQQNNLDTRALVQACSANNTFRDIHVEPGVTPDQTRLLITLPEAAIKQGDESA